MTIAPTQGHTPAPPTVPAGQVVLQPPPEIQPSDGVSGLLANVIPMLGSVGSIVFVAVSQPGPRGMIAAGMFLVASLGFVGVNGWRQRAQHQAAVVGARREYLAYLADLRGTVRQVARAQRRRAEWNAPDPRVLAAVAEERTRVWERGPDHEEYLRARVGVGTEPLALELEPPQTPPLAQLDPVAASAAHRFLVTHRIQRDIPLSVDLRSTARLQLAGSEEECQALARAIVAQLATFHSPDDVQVAVLASDRALPEWDWVKWLPHAHSTRHKDAVGAARMIGTTLAEIEDLLPEGLRERPRFGPAVAGSNPQPHLVVVVDGGQVPAGNAILTDDGVMGVTVLEIPERWDDLDDMGTLRLLVGTAVERDGVRRAPVDVLRLGAEPSRLDADQLSVVDAEAAARRLLPMHLDSHDSGDEGPAVSSELVDLLGLGDIRDLDLDVAWRPRLARDRLRVPIGLTPGGQPVALDIKESAQQGMGPHGLIIGATGSGKSEVLRTLVLALALTHSSEDLNFVLVDFKGGATFAGMADMPHVSAIITNLGEELTLVDRMQDALQGEMVRRQELLRSAGNFANVADYEKARRDGRTDLAPLPALLIVADEFSELLTAKPEFVDLFVAIGRLGRSLQMHLLLSSQRLEEGRLRGLESHLSYRIGLRTFSAAESRTVLGVPDAYELPPVPGVGYLKPDPTTMVRFRASYVSGPPKGRRRSVSTAGTTSGRARIESFTAAPVLSPVRDEQPVEVVETDAEERATFDIAVQRMKGRGPAAHQVWLPPLIVPSTYDELMPDLQVHPELGLVSPAWRGAGALTVPLGIVDRPLEQRRENLVVQLTGAAGHMAVVGGPRSGKSTVLRSVLTGLSLTHTPLEVQFYVLDFGGGTFAPLARAPHVAGVATRSEADVVRRVVAEVEGIVDARERYFRAQGIDSVETYRARRAQGLADDGYGDVFLVVDGWSTIRAEFDELEARLQTLAGRGLTFGVHLLVAAARWMDFRSQVKDLFGTRIELRLGDTGDSEIDRKVAANVPKGRPGRGLVASKHHVLTALPRVDGDSSPETVGDGVAHLVQVLTQSWTGRPGPKLRLLPEQVTLDQVRAASPADTRQILLGVDEAALAPVGVDLREEDHLYLFGDGGSGKSAFLRSVASEIQRLHTPAEAQIFAVDLRRSLLGEIPADYLAGYLTTQEQATSELSDLAAYLRTRLPGPDVTAQQLRTRSWWSGAEVYVLVDDYDLVATSMGNPVAALVPLLAQAGDVGLHLVVARRTGGAGRALYEPVLQSLRDLAAPGIVLSGSPDEGALIGGAKPVPSVPGRAQLVTRDRGRQVVQLVWSPPTT
ncbi:type VII secretion protein EccC [Cellulomonas fimi]|uniref:Cell division protein FtsK/SpoIIIE n=1 Tax=Cellulomonas fimi (strain ATCC 484 / DSM 20113 / JCM 1341 / CCUG 24087 / LMG 16345 / NBRC 15513 / NCIMB 8980 / NCTC 7547 / NRS-133) TaxID=590998 RepID=F4H1B6_CELFA|nr:type VII secretion protein EccC [Cellulomonas fimi]AEE45087.1 cell division protein FtsK/SpoIIIE [Cellulomonas fimi ATCC 484]NNH09136.1 type VII secretion protein EccC [Cellulomonas fimi]VEH28197.1 Type VII secretion system protein EccCa1 [Cellulomonas fimi]